MKTLSLLMTAALAMPAAAASSYRTGRSLSYRHGSTASYHPSGFATARSFSHFSGGGFAKTSALATTGGATSTPGSSGGSSTAPPPNVPGWLANPQVGALIRTAGMGFKTSDPGPAHLSVDYSAANWADVIAHIPQYAQYATGIGVMQGPPDTPPYPGGRGGGAGGNGIFTNGPVLGLDGNGNTTTTINGGIHGGNGNNGGHGGNASNGN